MRTEPPLRTFLRTFVSTNGRRRPSYAPFFYFGVLFIAREGKCGAKRGDAGSAGCRERMIRMRTPGTHVEMRIGDVAAKPSL